MSLRNLDYGHSPPTPGYKGACDVDPGPGAYGSGMNGNVTAAPRAPGAVELTRRSVEEQVDRLHDSRRALQLLRDRLFGDELVGEGCMPSTPPGELGYLCHELDRLEFVVDEIRRLTRWIEERL